MDFTQFAALDAAAVTGLVQERWPNGLGVGIPFNGTRRWYMATFNKSAEAVYSADYLEQVFGQMRVIMAMMFADGIHTIYTPIMGHDLAERGDEYMQFGLQAIANIARDDVITWYTEHHIDAACYGQFDLLPDNVRQAIDHMRNTTQTASVRHYLRFGVFADRSTSHLISLICQLRDDHGTPPTAEQLLHRYYAGTTAPVGLWIGSDQPTVFDVPLVFHGNTALYFLQYPTLYLDQSAWRRLLYDVLFVRGDQETLYPDNVAPAQHIMGLGVRESGGWVPSMT